MKDISEEEFVELSLMDSWSGQGVNWASDLAALFYVWEECGCSLLYSPELVQICNPFLTCLNDHISDVMKLLNLNIIIFILCSNDDISGVV